MDSRPPHQRCPPEAVPPPVLDQSSSSLGRARRNKLNLFSSTPPALPAGGCAASCFGPIVVLPWKSQKEQIERVGVNQVKDEVTEPWTVHEVCFGPFVLLLLRPKAFNLKLLLSELARIGSSVKVGSSKDSSSPLDPPLPPAAISDDPWIPALLEQNREYCNHTYNRSIRFSKLCANTVIRCSHELLCKN
ncbi:hypothetical protein L2E82_02218 [Cichorium intybus]|uniref:Uncharacterized protein n=1 Tax=Cichorium intybus TaxID=13427 RepID=A0ACB9H261_CICIN|nr:hypothetical protein L2E82_02218 [Cichorium intybus]